VKRSREFKVGLLAVVSLTSLYFGFNFLKGTDFFTTENTYYVVFDNIDGLTKSNSVILNGLAIGRVEEVEISPKIQNKILVTLHVDRAVVLSDSTVALLTKTDLLGEKAIVLQLKQGNRKLVNKDTLVGIKEKGITEVITERAMPVLQNFDTTLINFSKLSQEYTKAGERLNTVLDHVTIASRDIAQITGTSKKQVEAILSRTDDLLQSLQATKKTLDPAIAKLATMVDTLNDTSLAETLENAKQASAQLEQVITKINEGQGTLGKLVNNDSLYQNLNNLSASLDKLAIDFRERPKRYVHFSVFGRKEKKEK
jgi:phospholipid/cholesterol/gamma-HCH transport system substrate-binding protein